MGRLLLKGKDLRKLGYTEGKVIGRAIQVMHGYYKHSSKNEALEVLQQVLSKPEAYIENEVLGRFCTC